MSRRIDIELTSDRGDGTWTWRAAGAKQPKGSLDGTLLPEGATVGQELRAEVEATLDGTDVVAVLPPKAKNRAKVETIELLARPVADDELVTSKLAGKGKRSDRGDRDGRGRGRDGGRGRGDGDRGRGRDGGRGRGDGDRGRGRGDRPGGDRDRDRNRGDRSDRPRRDRPAPPSKPKPKRLRAGRAHRKEALEKLPEVERVIAEQVLQGGIPAVRQAVAKQNEQAKASGGREVAAEPLLTLAERLLPDLRAAEWQDKAEAALADIDELDLRDLRSVVVAAESGAKGAEARDLATKLQAGLAARVDKEQNAWLAELTETLAEGRTVRALRLSSRPPKAGAPLPPEVAAKLAEAASAALTSDTMADRWATVLDALSYSPVRLTVVPASKPESPSAELIATITKLSGRVPKVAEAFGIEASTAPSPRRSRGGKGKGKKKSGGGAEARSPKIPSPPPLTDAKAPAEAKADADDGPPEAPAAATPPDAESATPATDAATPAESATPAPEAAPPAEAEAAPPAAEEPPPTTE